MEKIHEPFFAGFELSGNMKKDGLIHPHVKGDPIKDWPDSVLIFGQTYKLERIVFGEEGYQCAEYC